MLAGKWTYRSYHNQTALVGNDAAAALALIFGEGVFDLSQDGDRVRGALGMGTDYALTIVGSCDTAGFVMHGTGIDGTPTAGWHYDYAGVPGYRWPEAVDQVDCLLGTVVRVTAHGPTSPAGVTASFIAVRQSDNPPPRTLRQSKLVAGL